MFVLVVTSHTSETIKTSLQNTHIPLSDIHYFVNKFTEHLKSNGYTLPKHTTSNDFNIWTVTRISADKQYKQNNHKNPSEKNLKLLNNYGIFEEIKTTTTVLL